MTATTNPHDRLFKAVFSNPQNAATHLGACLPSEITNALDLSRTEHIPGSWVDEALGEHHSDLLFRIPLRATQTGSYSDDEPPGALLYVLFEHQSTVDSHMALKVHRYLTRALDDWSREHPHCKLPLTLPLVLYHGAEPWTAPLELEGLYELALLDEAAVEALQPFRPRLRYLLQAVTDMPDEHIPGRGAARLTLLVFKHGREEHLAALLLEWQEDFRIEAARGEPGLHNIRLIVHYILVVNDNVTTQQLREALKPMEAETQDILNSTGRMLIEQGREEGREEGRKAEQERLAAKLLAKGTPPAQVAELTDLPLEEVQRLTH